MLLFLLENMPVFRMIAIVFYLLMSMEWKIIFLKEERDYYLGLLFFSALTFFPSFFRNVVFIEFSTLEGVLWILLALVFIIALIFSIRTLICGKKKGYEVYAMILVFVLVGQWLLLFFFRNT